jgi:hypothetical protein
MGIVVVVCTDAFDADCNADGDNVAFGDIGGDDGREWGRAVGFGFGFRFGFGLDVEFEDGDERLKDVRETF